MAPPKTTTASSACPGWSSGTSRARPPIDANALSAPERLQALRQTRLLDSEPDDAFDRFTRLVSRGLDVPGALVSLVDDQRQFFKSAVGLPEPSASERQTPLTHSFCQHVITSAQPLLVTDARQHPLACDNLAVPERGVTAYAGVPLITSKGDVLGALCAFDSSVRVWSDAELEMLTDLAVLTVTEIELRQKVYALEESRKDQLLMKHVVDCMQDSVVVSDRQGRVLIANEAARRCRPPANMGHLQNIADYGVFEADGKTPFAITSSPLYQAYAGEVVSDVEVVVRFPGQSDRVRNVTSAPVRDAEGAIRAIVSVARDVTTAKKTRAALMRSERLLRTVMSNLPNGAAFLFDHDLRYLLAEGEQLLSGIGLTADEVVGKTLHDIASDGNVKALESAFRAALNGQRTQIELSREQSTYALTAVPAIDEFGNVFAGVALSYDITSMKRIERKANQDAERLELLQAVAAGANSARSPEIAFKTALELICQFLGWPLAHVYLRHGNQLRTSHWWYEDRTTGFAAFRKATEELELAAGVGLAGGVLESGKGELLFDLTDPRMFSRSRAAIQAGLTAVFLFPVLIGDEVVAVLEFFADTDRRPEPRIFALMTNIGTQLGRVLERERTRVALEQQTERIRALSTQDDLTGLLNRRGFMGQSEQQLELCAAAQSPALLFFVDLNGLKAINDELGHDVGDEALAEAASVLQDTFRASDLVARLGGDEFVAFLPGLDDSMTEFFAERIQEEIASRNAAKQRRYQLSASIGSCAYDPARPITVDLLLASADARMYEQKPASSRRAPAATAKSSAAASGA